MGLRLNRFPFLLALCALFLSTTAADLRAQDDEEEIDPEILAMFMKMIGTCESLPDKIESCTPASCEAEFPFGPEEEKPIIVKRTVIGLNEEKKCGYTETVPPDSMMVCSFPEDARKQFAAEMRESQAELKKGNLSISTSTKDKDPKPTDHCVIRDKDGNERRMNVWNKVPKDDGKPTK